MPFWRKAAIMPTAKMVLPDPPRMAAMTIPGIGLPIRSVWDSFKDLNQKDNGVAQHN
jgi:hypothetical protein